MGRQYLVGSLEKSGTNLDEVATSFVDGAKSLVEDVPFRTCESKAPADDTDGGDSPTEDTDESPQVEHRRKIEGESTLSSVPVVVQKEGRQRRYWTAEEDAVLLEERRKRRRWVDIAPLIPSRTAQHCKDRWRLIGKDEPDTAPLRRKTLKGTEEIEGDDETDTSVDSCTSSGDTDVIPADESESEFSATSEEESSDSEHSSSDDGSVFEL